MALPSVLAILNEHPRLSFQWHLTERIIRFLNMSDYPRRAKIYWFSITSTGLLVIAWSLLSLRSLSAIQWAQFAGLEVVVLGSALFAIKIPGTQGVVTPSDTFVFLAVLLLGPEPATLVAASDALMSSKRVSKRRTSWIGGSAMMGLAIFVNARTFYFIVGHYYSLGVPLNPEDFSRSNMLIFPMLLLMIGAHVLNTMLIAANQTNKLRLPFLRFWRDNYLWTFWTYFAGVVAAALIFLTVIRAWYWYVFASIPVIIATYITYKVYFERFEEKTRRLDENNSHIAEIGKLHLATVEALAIAIDAKDQTTHGHVRRVQLYAVELGKLLGASPEDLRAIEAASLLHDIGKLAVPDHILNKPGKLTSAEFERIKIHPSVGGDILKKVGFPYPVEPMVRHHHERWDGQGYPDGLKGEAIPLGARILAVVDCYDALRADRPYRKGQARGWVQNYLLERRGTLYDPKVVAAFCENLDGLEMQASNLQIEEMPEEMMSPRRGDHLPAAGLETDRLYRREPKYLLDISSAHQEILALYEIAHTFGSALSINEIVTIMGRRLEKIVPYTSCAVLLKTEGNDEIEVVQAFGRNAEEFAKRRVRLGRGICGWVAVNNRPMYNNDPRLDLDELCPQVADQYSSLAVLPLAKEEHVLGVLALYSSERSQFTTDHVRLLETVVGLASDAVSNALVYEQTKQNALSDWLTKLPNSRALYVYWNQILGGAKRNNAPVTILGMDLDGFKSVNDTYGHRVGDQLLIEIGKLIQSGLRETDIVVRFAGDEFVAVLPNTNSVQAHLLVERLQSAVDDYRMPVRVNKEVQVGISIGLASYPDDGQTLEDLLSTADSRMYENKAFRKVGSSPASFVAFGPRMLEKSTGVS